MIDERILLVGLGQLGMSLLETLLKEKKNRDIMVIDSDASRIKMVQDKVHNVLVLDATDWESLREFTPHNFDVAIVTMGENFQNCLFISVLLKEMGVKKVIARASSKLEERILLKSGVDMAVSPEIEIGKKLGLSLLNKTLLGSIPLSGGISICTADVPLKLIGKSLKEINFRRKYKVNVAVVQHQDKAGNEMLVPDSDYLLREGDILVLVGNEQKLSAFTKDICGK
ncbi:MAG: TrkA family potassium uptake protein [Spirochaetales bacterium]|nr:TrkA family potassium uptake protein [Spirochaetales bacterium]